MINIYCKECGETTMGHEDIEREGAYEVYRSLICERCGSGNTVETDVEEDDFIIGSIEDFIKKGQKDTRAYQTELAGRPSKLSAEDIEKILAIAEKTIDGDIDCIDSLEQEILSNFAYSTAQILYLERKGV